MQEMELERIETENEILADKKHAEEIKKQVEAMLQAEAAAEEQAILKLEQARLDTLKTEMQKTLEQAIAIHEANIKLYNEYLEILDKEIKGYDEKIKTLTEGIQANILSHFEKLRTHQEIILEPKWTTEQKALFAAKGIKLPTQLFVQQDDIVSELKRNLLAKWENGEVKIPSDITSLSTRTNATPIIAAAIAANPALKRLGTENAGKVAQQLARDNFKQFEGAVKVEFDKVEGRMLEKQFGELDQVRKMRGGRVANKGDIEIKKQQSVDAQLIAQDTKKVLEKGDWQMVKKKLPALLAFSVLENSLARHREAHGTPSRPDPTPLRPGFLR